MYEKTLHLEDLLELQHLRDPVCACCAWSVCCCIVCLATGYNNIHCYVELL